MNLRGTYWAFGLAFVMLVAAVAAYGLNAPDIVGDLLLVAMVAFGVVGFIVGVRDVNRFKHNVRVAQQSRAQEKARWDD